MSQEAVNIKNRTMRSNSFGNSVASQIIHPSTVHCNIVRSPIMHNYQNRPVSHCQPPQSYQPNHFAPKPPLDHANHIQRLESAARVIPFERHIPVPPHQLQHNRSVEKDDGSRRVHFNHYAENSAGKYPLHSSTFISNRKRNSTLIASPTEVALDRIPHQHHEIITPQPSKQV